MTIFSLTIKLSFLLGLILWTNPTLLPFVNESLRKDEFDLKYGSWGIVCGASEGIGLEWAFALAERGLNVVLVGRNGAKLREVKDDMMRAIPHLQYVTIEVDLGDVNAWRKVAQELSMLDVGFLVYNAAYSPVGQFASFPMELQEHAVNVNVHGPTIALSAIIPTMVKKGKGGIVLMSSVDGEGCSPYVINYSGTKAWATRMAEGLWYELKPHGIDVLGVVAGLTTTPSISRIMDQTKRKDLLWAFESTPREVVIESLRALAKGQPVVITGTGSKLVTWLRWFIPRSLGCSLMSVMETVLKSEEDRQTAAKQMMGPSYKGRTEL